MCGICGFVNNLPVEEKYHRIKPMMDSISHRGPDDNWKIADELMAFGFRRLSIIDVKGGRQPLSNEDGSIWIVFNGEIYNHQKLRQILLGCGHHFKTKTDTEVLVHGYEQWGIKLLDKIQGMFAFSIWDKKQQKLFAAVDRSGIKPFYYSHSNNRFIFASEAKGLFASGLITPKLETSAVPYHMAYLWAPHPLTAFKGVNKLAPGHYLTFHKGKLLIEEYWDLKIDEDNAFSAEEWSTKIREELKTSVRQQMESEVPLGAFLSGGIDSAAICKFMNDLGGEKPINTYFIGFSREDMAKEVLMDERPYARVMADAIGSNHIEHDLNPNIESLIKKLVWHMDEPIGDPAAISSYFVSQRAHETSTVLLSGVAGDEIFAGYPRYLAMQLIGNYKKLPTFSRVFLQLLVNRLPGGRNALFRNIKKFIKSAGNDEFSSYLQMLTYFNQQEQKKLFSETFYEKIKGVDITLTHKKYYDRAIKLQPLNRLQYLDYKTFLPCLNLMYTDKMSMAASIEVRVPFLHEPFVESMFRLPPKAKIKGRTRKYIFKKAMESDLPHDIVWRRKAGFGAPIHSWISGTMKEMISDYLSSDRLKKQDIFNHHYIENIMMKERENKDYLSNHIWQLFIFQIWHEIYLGHDSPQT